MLLYNLQAVDEATHGPPIEKDNRVHMFPNTWQAV